MLKLAQTDQHTNRPTDQQTNRQGKNNMSPTTIYRGGFAENGQEVQEQSELYKTNIQKDISSSVAEVVFNRIILAPQTDLNTVNTTLVRTKKHMQAMGLTRNSKCIPSNLLQRICNLKLRSVDTGVDDILREIETEVVRFIEMFRQERRSMSPLFKLCDEHLTKESLPIKILLAASRH
ncbi:hypothetical protein DPMN_090583 [Dreissena polymorpha]|uniref:Uncharacterized protein n=1 Tax=Dreissena polymorpha TaxID=45954 RepID=A0A9D4KYZ9_DREPO|nr:hypothetical protein DPMN_090583 [Dreissena polymorpha]